MSYGAMVCNGWSLEYSRLLGWHAVNDETGERYYITSAAATYEEACRFLIRRLQDGLLRKKGS